MGSVMQRMQYEWSKSSQNYRYSQVSINLIVAILSLNQVGGRFRSAKLRNNLSLVY